MAIHSYDTDGFEVEFSSDHKDYESRSSYKLESKNLLDYEKATVWIKNPVPNDEIPDDLRINFHKLIVEDKKTSEISVRLETEVMNSSLKNGNQLYKSEWPVYASEIYHDRDYSNEPDRKSRIVAAVNDKDNLLLALVLDYGKNSDTDDGFKKLEVAACNLLLEEREEYYNFHNIRRLSQELPAKKILEEIYKEEARAVVEKQENKAEVKEENAPQNAVTNDRPKKNKRNKKRKNAIDKKEKSLKTQKQDSAKKEQKINDTAKEVKLEPALEKVIEKTEKENKDKSESAMNKMRFSKTLKKIALSLGLLVGGAGAGIGAKALFEKISEDMRNNALNKEWMADHAKADSAYADAKNAHFYAITKMTEEQKSQYMKHIDELEKKYVKLAQDDNLLKAVAGNQNMKPVPNPYIYPDDDNVSRAESQKNDTWKDVKEPDNIVINHEGKEFKFSANEQKKADESRALRRSKWFKLGDGSYIEDNRLAGVYDRLDNLRQRINRGIADEIIADGDHGERKSDGFFAIGDKDYELDEAVSSKSIKKVDAKEIEGWDEDLGDGWVVQHRPRIIISRWNDGTGEIPGTVSDGVSGEAYKKLLAQQIADRKQKDSK